jgi:Na+/H+-dicarboxylate symporter
LLTVCAGSVLIAGVFGLMAAWTGLQGFIGSLGASLVLAIAFVVASLVVLGILRSVLHRTRGQKDIS